MTKKQTVEFSDLEVRLLRGVLEWCQYDPDMCINEEDKYIAKMALERLGGPLPPLDDPFYQKEYRRIRRWMKNGYKP